jgi:hypothetical protein
MSVTESFKQRAPGVMAALMHYFPPLDVEGSAAVLGNIWAESKLQAINEGKPTVKGSRGGYGWAQWTGPRRRAAETFWRDRGMNASTDAAQLAFLISELQTTEKRGILAVMRPGTLEERTKAFELAYERAGAKNYPERYKGARLALAAFNANPIRFDGDKLPPQPPVERKWAEDHLAVFEIRAIQQRLKDIGLGAVLGKSGSNKDGVDGSWGPLTAAAIRVLQERKRITPDGHYGPQTKQALAEGFEEPTPPIEKEPSMEAIINLLTSKTLIGIAVAALSPLLSKYGVTDGTIAELVQAAGLALATLGRVTATKTITGAPLS